MVRGAVDMDVGAIATLSEQLGYPARAPEVQDRLKVIQTRGDGQVFVAEIDGSVIGWVHVFGAHVLESPAHAEVGGLVVDTRHRRRGIGGKLMRAAERWAVSMGYSTVRLRSNVIRDPAHSFYRRLGYSETKRQAVFVRAVTPEGGGEHRPAGEVTSR